MDSIPHDFYTYMFYRNGIPFYVGKGRKERMEQHFACARNRPNCRHLACRVIRKEWREGGEITAVKIADGIPEVAAFRLEKLYISLGAVYHWPLVNQTFGGEGVAGYIRDAEWGKRRSQLAKQMVAEGRYDHLKTVNIGRKHSIGEREKRSQSLTEAWTDPELRELKSQQSKQMWGSPGHREKQRQAMANPEIHEKLAYWKSKESSQARTYPGFMAPDGTIYENVRNLTRFAREHNLHTSGMCLVAQGKQSSHKGWTRYEPKISQDHLPF